MGMKNQSYYEQKSIASDFLASLLPSNPSKSGNGLPA